MTATPDLVINALALAAVLTALAPLHQARRGSAVAARLFALHLGLAALLVARLLAWSGSGFATVPLMLAASWLPLLAVRVSEQLVRRHAPAWMKWSVLAGGIGFTVVSIVTGSFWSAAVLSGLALFQGAAVFLSVWLMVRARNDISPAEARLATIFGTALLISIPLSATDFRTLFDLPVRGGAFAVLLIVLATSRFVGGTASWLLLVVDLAVVGTAGVFLALSSASLFPDADAFPLASMGAVGAATTALALIIQRRGETRMVARARPSLLAALRGLPDSPSEDVLLSAHPLLADGRLIDQRTLESYPAASIDTMARARVLTREDGDAPRDLLDANAASHLLRLSRKPARFLAVSAGGIGGDSLTLELDTVARVLDGGRP